MAVVKEERAARLVEHVLVTIEGEQSRSRRRNRRRSSSRSTGR